jgi:predicted nucleotidyltransferase
MADSPSRRTLGEIIEELDAARVDYVVIGVTAAALQGAPLLTEDVDVMVRDTAATHRKIAVFAKNASMVLSRPAEPLSRFVRASSEDATVDFVFNLSGGATFESIRSRSLRIEVAGRTARVASLEDVIASKQAAGRPKDLAVLPILRDTLAVKQAIAAVNGKEPPAPARRRRS